MFFPESAHEWVTRVPRPKQGWEAAGENAGCWGKGTGRVKKGRLWTREDQVERVEVSWEGPINLEDDFLIMFICVDK